MKEEDFERLSMMDLRKEPGEMLERVKREGKRFILERHGKPMACVVPISDCLPELAKSLNWPKNPTALDIASEARRMGRTGY